MLKRTVFALTLLTCVSIAYGAAVKIMSFQVWEANPNADAMAILNYASGQDKTIVQLIMSGFEENETYSLRLVDPDSDAEVEARCDVFTDNNGHATFHTSFATDISSYDVTIWLADLDQDPPTDPCFADERAFGDNPSS